MALEAARRVAEAGDAQVDVVAVAAVSEEVGYFGARTAAFSLEPDVAIAIDVTTRRTSRRQPRLSGKVELGGGATIERGPMINTHVFDLLVRAAEEEEIPHTFEVATRSTRTDADQIHVSRGGVPTGLVSIPLRYMHSPCELVCLDDVESAIRLIVAFARRLTRDQSFIGWHAARTGRRVDGSEPSSSARCGRRSGSSAAASPATRRPSSARSRSAPRSSAPGSSRTSRST